jgi:hypothetical protein
LLSEDPIQEDYQHGLESNTLILLLVHLPQAQLLMLLRISKILMSKSISPQAEVVISASML